MLVGLAQTTPIPVPLTTSGETLAQSCAAELAASGGQPLATNPYILNMALEGSGMEGQNLTGCPPGYTLTQAGPPNVNQPCGYYQCLNAAGQNVSTAVVGPGSTNPCTGFKAIPTESWVIGGAGLVMFLLLGGWLKILAIPVVGFAVLNVALTNLGPQVNLQTGQIECVAQGLEM